MFGSECSRSLLSVAVLHLVSLVGSQAGPVPSVCPVMSSHCSRLFSGLHSRTGRERLEPSCGLLECRQCQWSNQTGAGQYNTAPSFQYSHHQGVSQLSTASSVSFFVRILQPEERGERREERERSVTTELTTDWYQHSPGSGSPSPWTGSDTRREYRAATV